MFIRTRDHEGFIFYLGSDIANPIESFIAGELTEGNLVVHVIFGGKKEKFQVLQNLNYIFKNSFKNYNLFRFILLILAMATDISSELSE